MSLDIENLKSNIRMFSKEFTDLVDSIDNQTTNRRLTPQEEKYAIILTSVLQDLFKTARNLLDLLQRIYLRPKVKR